jgi:hypothetical protein
VGGSPKKYGKKIIFHENPVQVRIFAGTVLGLSPLKSSTSGIDAKLLEKYENNNIVLALLVNFVDQNKVFVYLIFSPRRNSMIRKNHSTPTLMSLKTTVLRFFVCHYCHTVGLIDIFMNSLFFNLYDSP